MFEVRARWMCRDIRYGQRRADVGVSRSVSLRFTTRAKGYSVHVEMLLVRAVHDSMKNDLSRCRTYLER